LALIHEGGVEEAEKVEALIKEDLSLRLGGGR
jgi:hypothetical protein